MTDDSAEMSEQLLTFFGIGSGVLQVVVFTWVSVMLFESVVYGVAVGGFFGAGAFFFVPWLLSYSASQDGTNLEPASDGVSRSTGSGVFGLGLEFGAMAMLTLGFIREPPALLLGVAIALTVAVGVYLVGSFVLER